MTKIDIQQEHLVYSVWRVMCTRPAESGAGRKRQTREEDGAGGSMLLAPPILLLYSPWRFWAKVKEKGGSTAGAGIRGQVMLVESSIRRGRRCPVAAAVARSLSLVFAGSQTHALDVCRVLALQDGSSKPSHTPNRSAVLALRELVSSMERTA